MGFHLDVPRISALSKKKNMRNEKRLWTRRTDRSIWRRPAIKRKDWRTVSTLKGKESRYCTHGSTTVSSTEKSLHFWTSLSRKAISLRARWRRLGTDGAPLGDVTFQPFVPIKVKDAVAIPMVTTPDTNGRASQGEELVNQQRNWTTLTQRLDQVKFPLPKGAHLDRMTSHGCPKLP